MLHALMSLIASCWKPFEHSDDAVNAAAGRECKDDLLWFRDIGKFAISDFSMAVIQANQVVEDHFLCQALSNDKLKRMDHSIFYLYLLVSSFFIFPLFLNVVYASKKVGRLFCLLISIWFVYCYEVFTLKMR